ncbi:hypothetical protein IT568_11430, partial [bacterium]|nr:hypothetical protein [bacterium]
EGMWSGSFYSQDSVYKEINVVMVVDTVENSAARFVNTYQSKIICGKIDKSFTTGVLPFKKFFNNEFSFSMAYEDSTNLQLQNYYKGKFFSSTQCSLTVKTPFNSVGNNGEIVTVLTHQ